MYSLPNKTGPVLLQNIFKLCIRIWTPPRNILTDQEGGLVSAAADTFFDPFRIKRKLVGKDGATSKGLAERHIQLAKLAMLKLKKLLEKDGIDISHSELVQEVCMSQNLLLEYGGGSPQTALTGQATSDWWGIEPSTVSQITGAHGSRPDDAKTMLRTRLLAKQAIMQSIVEDRLFLSDHLRMHKHQPQMLLPGAMVDIWRKPDRKDQDGWRGPAEIISVDRHSGSATVQHQGLPLLIPFRNLCKHALETFFDCIHFSNATGVADNTTLVDNFLCNPTCVDAAYRAGVQHGLRFDKDDAETATTCKLLMDIVDGTAFGKLV